MKKTIISLCTVVTMFISFVSWTIIDARATINQTEGSTRRLTEIEVYDGLNTLTEDYEFQYDDDFLTGIISRRHGKYTYETSVVLSYDTAGRLVSLISGDPNMPGMSNGAKYTYNNAGQLISRQHWEGSGSVEIFEYDTAGKRVRSIENYDMGNTVTEYIYNEKGLVSSTIQTSTIEWSGEIRTVTTDYSYDSQNLIAKTSYTDGKIYTFTSYDYGYQPFVLYECIDNYSNTYSNLLLLDDNGYTLHSFNLYNPEFQIDAEGYLIKIVDTSNYSDGVQTYVFNYEGITDTVVGEDSTSTQPEAWNQVYYDFIIQDRKNADSSEDWEFVGYELIYLDDDTIPELWITYSSWAAGCRIVSYRDGKLIHELLGSGTLSYEEYGNVFCHAYGHMGVYSDTILKLENGKLITVAEGWNQKSINDDGSQNYEVMNYFWNDTPVSKETYAKNIESLINTADGKETSEDTQHSYVEILEYLSSVVIIPNEVPDEEVKNENGSDAYSDYNSDNETKADQDNKAMPQIIIIGIAAVVLVGMGAIVIIKRKEK